MSRAFYFVLLLLVFLVVQTLPAAARDRAASEMVRNPMLSSDQIRALRLDGSQQTGTEPVLQAIYRGGNGGKLRVLAAGDYGAWEEAEGFNIFDYRLRRIFVLDSRQQRFFNRSMYAEVHFALTGMRERVLALKSLQQKGKDPAEILSPDRFDPFWMATTTGIPYGRSEYGGAQREDLTEGGFTLTYKGEIVLRFEPSSQPFPAPLIEAFYRTIERGIALPPAAVLAMIETGRLPQKLQSKYWDIEAKRFMTGEFSLQSAEILQADYPLPAGWLAGQDMAAPDYFKQQFLPLMYGALVFPDKASRRGFAQYRKTIDAAMQHDAKFDALLLLHEALLTQQIPCPGNDDACGYVRAIVQRTADDPAVQLLTKASQLAKQNKPHQAINTLLQISRDGLSAGHVIDIYHANYASELLLAADILTPEQVRDIEGRIVAGYRAGMRGNAWIARLYQDIGDFLLYQNQSYAGWQAWDIGRSLFDGEAKDMMRKADEAEALLLKMAPWKFGLRN